MVYKCDYCDEVYKTKDSLRKHTEFKHSAVQSLQCVKCVKHFLNKYSLKNHLYRVHPSQLHSCTFCGSSFKASIGIK
jgi:hypothetical protein